MNIHVSITDGSLPPSSARRDYDAGAVLYFEGVVRPTEDGQPLEALDYEVYEPMARRTLAQLAEQAGQRFKLLSVEVEHSRGKVSAGACSFRLCVASSHRAEAIEATAWFIDRMKQDVPIWKRPIRAVAREVASP
ncbi:MAG: molybdenum cofactor biosynthesis protein MoaE [Phycisphaeraceae bacterium]|nr:molybdenum cofactor biosynthesis protein MoaE [Phycisphaeraceae bacterium]